MATHVAQLAAAEVAPPAPGEGKITGMVGAFRSGPEPEIIVEFLG